MLFFAGMTQVLLVMAWWAAELLTRTGGQSLSTSISAAWAHGFLMLYGVFPFFIFGFLFTVYPRWMGTEPLPARYYVAAFALLTAGMALFYLGLFGTRAVLLAGVALYALGWAAGLAALLTVYARAPRRGAHESLLNAALVAGLAGVCAFGVAVARNEPLFHAVAREIGLWLFLVPVVFLVAHRMVPFFSHAVLMNYLMRRPAWAPPLTVLCAGAHAAFELAGLPQWRFLADAPLAAAALHLSWVWQFRESFHARLLAMLHIAFLWLGIAMALYTLQSVVLLVAGTDPFGRAPLHALGIGFFTGMVVAMASRVTLGHSGRALVADRLTWAVLLGVNAVAALRLAAEFAGAAGAGVNAAAAVLWLGALGLWARHSLPIYWRPRVDRLPG